LIDTLLAPLGVYLLSDRDNGRSYSSRQGDWPVSS